MITRNKCLSKIFYLKKTISIAEFIIAISLLMVIVLGAASFDVASSEFLKSAERKTEVVNDLTFVLEHLQKNINAGVRGGAGLKAMTWTGATSTLVINQNQSGTVTATYVFNSPNITFTKSGNSPEIISSRYASGGVFAYDSNDDKFSITSMKFIFDTTKTVNNHNNPEANISNIHFFPLS